MRSRGGSTWALRMQSTRAGAARWSTHRSFRRHRGEQPSRTEHDAAADIVYIRSDGGLQGGGHGRCGEIGQSGRCLLMLASEMGNEEEERPQTSCLPAGAASVSSTAAAHNHDSGDLRSTPTLLRVGTARRRSCSKNRGRRDAVPLLRVILEANSTRLGRAAMRRWEQG
jgi:hypothetical protein